MRRLLSCIPNDVKECNAYIDHLLEEVGYVAVGKDLALAGLSAKQDVKLHILIGLRSLVVCAKQPS